MIYAACTKAGICTSQYVIYICGLSSSKKCGIHDIADSWRTILTMKINTSYKEGRVEIPVTGLAPPHICGCPKPGLDEGPSKWK